MQHPTEPDKPEILNGPGDEPRAARKSPARKNKTAIIAASALVVALAAGGVGFFLANGDKSPAGNTQTGQQTQQKPDPQLAEEEDASVGDVSTDEPKNGTGEDTPEDGTPQDAVPDDTPQNSTPESGTPKNPAKPGNGKPGDGKPDTGSAGTNTPEADNPADGPAGEMSGQCAKSGC